MSDANLAYTERNKLVVLLAHLVYVKGWKMGRYWDDSQEPGWENVVVIDLPTGQVSWHIGADDLAATGFDTLPEYDGTWDGHTTEEKWSRVFKLVQTYGAYGGYPSIRKQILEGK